MFRLYPYRSWKWICFWLLVGFTGILCVYIGIEIYRLETIMAVPDWDGQVKAQVSEYTIGGITYPDAVCYDDDVEYLRDVTYRGNVYYDGGMPELPPNNPFQETIDSLGAVINSLMYCKEKK